MLLPRVTNNSYRSASTNVTRVVQDDNRREDIIGDLSWDVKTEEKVSKNVQGTLGVVWPGANGQD